jgi:peptidylprolyl isomerase
MDIKVGIAVTIAIIVVFLFFVFGFGGFGSFMPQASSEAPTETANTAVFSEELGSVIGTLDIGALNDLYVQDLVAGSGDEAVAGASITVNYTGYLPNGTVFDSSIPRGTPFTFTLGSGQVIQGWERGFAGMKEGGKRVLVIPPSLGYGENQVGPIPPNATLIFEVELLEVAK